MPDPESWPRGCGRPREEADLCLFSPQMRLSVLRSNMFNSDLPFSRSAALHMRRAPCLEHVPHAEAFALTHEGTRSGLSPLLNIALDSTLLSTNLPFGLLTDLFMTAKFSPSTKFQAVLAGNDYHQKRPSFQNSAQLYPPWNTLKDKENTCIYSSWILTKYPHCPNYP